MAAEKFAPEEVVSTPKHSAIIPKVEVVSREVELVDEVGLRRRQMLDRLNEDHHPYDVFLLSGGLITVVLSFHCNPFVKLPRL